MYFIVSWYLNAVLNGFLVTPFLLQSLLKVPKVSSLSLNSLPYTCPFSLGQSIFPILKWDPSMQRGGRSSLSAGQGCGILLSWQHSSAHPQWCTQLRQHPSWKDQDRWKTLLSSLSLCLFSLSCKVRNHTVQLFESALDSLLGSEYKLKCIWLLFSLNKTLLKTHFTLLA